MVLMNVLTQLHTFFNKSLKLLCFAAEWVNRNLILHSVTPTVLLDVLVMIL